MQSPSRSLKRHSAQRAMHTRQAFHKAKHRFSKAVAKVSRDSVRIQVPKAFLSTLTLFCHHVSDAMAGDDRPDHGLAMIRQGRAGYQDPFHWLYGSLYRAEKRMTGRQRRAALQRLWHFEKAKKESETTFQTHFRSMHSKTLEHRA